MNLDVVVTVSLLTISLATVLRRKVSDQTDWIQVGWTLIQ